ncbi:hypothetical protein BOTBODRAFT_143920 [Botryobasidium botryosum FD-172 SS1]|uniref:Vps72/YL1 C-terminal domain-containing protein n=1 Tax=Botryobasidium botryosum (strain FD-172 SS1) TaxID=930990 RepID=A0A067N156_BOTB1|nr:hypothetical protein BOTBODRAFT_143920 [Botryobasidium botryosum FD-172 SS1]
MQVLLDKEFEAEELFEEVEDDQDFVSNPDEEDVYESDFQSTEEESDGDDALAGERQVEQEAKAARRLARQKLDKSGGVSGIRTATKRPPAERPNDETTDTAIAPAKKRRVSMGVVMDAETGEIIDSGKRQSTRTATMANKIELETKIKDAEQKKAALPKRPKAPTRAKTQDELIRDALETEEKNVVSLREFLTQEEEKRKQAKIERLKIEGPILRWISRAEMREPRPVVEVITASTPAPVPPAPPPVPAKPKFATPAAKAPGDVFLANLQKAKAASSAAFAAPKAPSTQNPYTLLSANAGAAHRPPPPPAYNPQLYAHPSQSIKWNTPTPAPSVSRSDPLPATSSVAPARSGQSASGLATSSAGQPGPRDTLISSSSTVSTSVAVHPHTTPQREAHPPSESVVSSMRQSTSSMSDNAPLKSTEPIPRASSAPPSRVKETQNYVVLETGSRGWKDDMGALFGRHVEWSQLKVVSTRNRPITRRVPQCAITGLPAQYRDPRTGIPFANAVAYKTISGLLDHRYVWSQELQCYIGDADRGEGASGVPSGWKKAAVGQ